MAAAAAPTIGASIAGAMVAGAAGSLASQAFGVAAGIQKGFSFKQVALSALSAGVGGGVGRLMPMAELGGSSFLADAARGVAGSVATQGIAVATGLQPKFDWAGVAAAGLSGGITGALAPSAAASRSLGGYAQQAIGGAAAAIAGGAVRTLAHGTNFGDNIMAALPDVIGSTIGNAVADAVNALMDPATSGGSYGDAEEKKAEALAISIKEKTLVATLAKKIAGGTPSPLLNALPANDSAAALQPAGVPGSAPQVRQSVEELLGPNVARNIERLSPTLMADLRRLKDTNWQIILEDGVGAYSDDDSSIIYVGRGLLVGDTEAIIMALAHEVGHALFVSTMDASSERAWIQWRSQEEGAATLYSEGIRREMGANGGRNIDLPGNTENHDDYRRIYNRYLRDGNHARAISEIGRIFETKERNSLTGEMYRTQWRREYEDRQRARRSGN